MDVERGERSAGGVGGGFPKVIEGEIASVVADIEKAFYDIPFENSAFQNVNFVVHSQLTPERAYRAIGLRLSAKIRALKECYFNRKLEDIDIAELEEKRGNAGLSRFERERAAVELEKKLSSRAYIDKLINDALVEVRTLYDEMKKYPRYTRPEFEAGERRHFEIRLQNQINGVTGAAESLLAMQHDMNSMLPAPKGQEALPKD